MVDSYIELITTTAIIFVFLVFCSIPIYTAYDTIRYSTEDVGEGSWIKENHEDSLNQRSESNLNAVFKVIPVGIIGSFIYAVIRMFRPVNDDRSGGGFI